MNLSGKRQEGFTSQKGFTLLEVMVGVAILGLVGVGLLHAFNTNTNVSGLLDSQITAANIASAYAEQIKDCDFAPAYPGENCTFSGIPLPPQYYVIVETQCSADTVVYAPCTGDESETFQNILVQVYREGGELVYTLCSYRAKR